MSDPTYHTSLERGEPHGSFGHKKDDHKDKDKYTDKYKDKDKVKIAPNMCYIFEKHRAQGC